MEHAANSRQELRKGFSPTKLARDTFITLSVSLGLIVVLELFLRLFFPQILTGSAIRGQHFSVADQQLGMRYIPGAIWQFRHPEYRVEYAINAEGFRDAKIRPADKPAGVTRVLLLGDSFTFGQGVNYEQAWPVLAEQRLAREGIAVDLIKAGMQGADTRSELILMRRLVQRYKVDAVVVGFLINDLYSNLPYKPEVGMESPPAESEEIQNKVFRSAGDDRTLHLVTLAKRIATITDAGYLALYLAAPDRGEYLRVPLSPTAQRQLGVTDTLLVQMAAYCDSLGKPLVVFSMPQQFQVMYARKGRADKEINVDYYDQHFRQLASDHGFDWISAFEALVQAEKASGNDMFYRLDGHFTAAGNAVAAEVFTRNVIPRILERVRRRAPAVVARRTSEDRVDEWTQHGTLSKYQQSSNHE